jgi:DNA-binding NarL/FixJ family response regulator
VIRILIVHGNSILSAGLRMMLSAALDLRVVGEADDDTAATMTVRLQPDIALIDADSCRAGGLAAVRAVHARCPHVGIVMLGLREDPETRAEANGAGAYSFVSKEEPATMLEEIRTLGGLLC